MSLSKEEIINYLLYFGKDYQIVNQIASYNVFGKINALYPDLCIINDNTISDNIPQKPMIIEKKQTPILIEKPMPKNENIEKILPKSDIFEKLSQDAEKLNSISEIKSYLEKSIFCEIKTLAKNTVLSEGVENADVILIGEAPGEEEDEKGIPFCGRSGRLLTNALNSINLTRDKNLYVTNTAFWRPPANRKPTQEEIALCRPFVIRQIEIIKPKLVILCGSVALEFAFQKEMKISDLRGTFFDLALGNFKTKATAIYHPSYLLRNPSMKKIMWGDCINIARLNIAS